MIWDQSIEDCAGKDKTALSGMGIGITMELEHARPKKEVVTGDVATLLYNLCPTSPYLSNRDRPHSLNSGVLAWLQTVSESTHLF